MGALPFRKPGHLAGITATMRRGHGSYRKGILFPCWVIQIAAELILVIFLGLVLGNATDTDDRKEFNVAGNPVAYAAVCIVVTILTLVLTIAAAYLYYRQRLTPIILLGICGIQTLIWSIFYLLDIVAVARGDGGGNAVGGAILLTIFLSSFVIALVHAVIVFRRRSPVYQSTPLIDQPRDALHPSRESWATFATHSTEYASIAPDHDHDAQGVPDPYSQRESSPQTPFTPPHQSSRAAPRSYFYNDDVDDGSLGHGPTSISASPPQNVHSRKPSYKHARNNQSEDFVSRKASVVSAMSTQTRSPHQRSNSETWRGDARRGQGSMHRHASSSSIMMSGARGDRNDQLSGLGLGIANPGHEEPGSFEDLGDGDGDGDSYGRAAGVQDVHEVPGSLRSGGGGFGGDLGQRAFHHVVGMEAHGSPEFKVSEGDASRILGAAVAPGKMTTPKIRVEEPPVESPISARAGRGGGGVARSSSRASRSGSEGDGEGADRDREAVRLVS